MGPEQRDWRPRTRSGRSSWMTIRTHIGVRLTVVRLSGVVETIVRSCPCTIYAASSKSVHPAAHFLSRGQSTSRLRVRNEASTTEFETVHAAPRLGQSRQHERGVNRRKQRIRSQNVGSQAKPWGFRPVSKPTNLQLENAPQPTEVKEC